MRGIINALRSGAVLRAVVLLAALAFAPAASAQSGPEPGGGNGTVSASGSLSTNTVPKAASAATLADSTITDSGTRVTINTASSFGAAVTVGSTTANFFDVVGTMPTSPASSAYGVAFTCTGAGSGGAAQQGCGLDFQAAGYTGAGSTYGRYMLNTSAGTSNAPYAAASDTNAIGNWAGFGEGLASTAGTVGGLYGAGFNTGSGQGVGVFGNGNGNTGPGVGGIFVSTAGATRTALYAGYNTTNPTLIGAVALIDNLAVANPLLVARDNGASLPSTGATATFVIKDGAVPQYGLGVLTSATMVAENQCIGGGPDCTSSYTWTNAQVTALAGTAGDITVATLPAKTQVLDAMVVITGAAAGPATVTVSCGDAIGGTPFVNLVAVADAKAAANTVYGDASAERGTSIDTEFWYLPSYTATTLVTCHYISTVANLSTTTGSTGRVILTTRLLP